MPNTSNPTTIDTNGLHARTREQYAASLTALAARANVVGDRKASPKISDLPGDLAKLVQDYLRTVPRGKLVLLSHQQFVDGQLKSVTGDRNTVPEGKDFVSLSRSLTLASATGVRAIVDLVVGRIEQALPSKRKGSSALPTKKEVKRTDRRRRAKPRGRSHA